MRTQRVKIDFGSEICGPQAHFGGQNARGVGKLRVPSAFRGSKCSRGGKITGPKRISGVKMLAGREILWSQAHFGGQNAREVGKLRVPSAFQGSKCSRGGKTTGLKRISGVKMLARLENLWVGGDWTKKWWSVSGCESVRS